MSQQMYTEQPIKNIFMHVLYRDTKVIKRSRYRATNTATYACWVFREMPARREGEHG
jgi:hypothetical protein